MAHPRDVHAIMAILGAVTTKRSLALQFWLCWEVSRTSRQSRPQGMVAFSPVVKLPLHACAPSEGRMAENDVAKPWFGFPTLPKLQRPGSFCCNSRENATRRGELYSRTSDGRILRACGPDEREHTKAVYMETHSSRVWTRWSQGGGMHYAIPVVWKSCLISNCLDCWTQVTRLVA